MGDMEQADSTQEIHQEQEPGITQELEQQDGDEVEDVQYVEEYVTTSDGRKLFGRYWKDIHDATPKAIVFVSHGYGEHGLYYKDVAKLLVKGECYVFSHDHTGHGNSDGDRVHVDDFKIYVNDILEHVDAVRGKFPAETKVFIIGHSMGGAVSVLCAMKRPDLFSGVVLIGPALALFDKINPNFVVKFLLKVYAKAFPQSIVQTFDIVNDKGVKISRNDELVKFFVADPLTHTGIMKAKFLVCFLQAIEDIQAQATKVEWPFIILHGTEDVCCPLDGSVKFHEKAISKDKALNVYQGFYHNLHNEPEPDGAEVRSDIRDWIVERL